MFGLLHFFAGLGVIAGATMYPSLRKHRTWYTLTERRAIISTNLPWEGKRLKSYPITKATDIDYRPGKLSTILFPMQDEGGWNWISRRGTNKVGFERITDGQKVMGLIRQVQEGNYS